MIPTKQDSLVRNMPAWEGRFEKNKVGVSLSNQRPLEGESTAVFIVAGQSLASNVNGDPGDPAYVPVNLAKCDMINIDDGGIYTCREPMLGAETAGGGRSIFIRLADKLISAGYRQRVILITVGIGSTTAVNWETELWRRIVIAQACAGLKGFTVNAVLWQQGEADTAAGTTQEAYFSSMSNLISKVRDNGVSAPWMLAKSTWWHGALSNPVRAAVDQLINGADILAGPDNDTLLGANRLSDNTHMTVPLGVEASAELWAGSIQASLP